MGASCCTAPSTNTQSINAPRGQSKDRYAANNTPGGVHLLTPWGEELKIQGFGYEPPSERSRRPSKASRRSSKEDLSRRPSKELAPPPPPVPAAAAAPEPKLVPEKAPAVPAVPAVAEQPAAALASAPESPVAKMQEVPAVGTLLEVPASPTKAVEEPVAAPPQPPPSPEKVVESAVAAAETAAVEPFVATFPEPVKLLEGAAAPAVAAASASVEEPAAVGTLLEAALVFEKTPNELARETQSQCEEPLVTRDVPLEAAAPALDKVSAADEPFAFPEPVKPAVHAVPAVEATAELFAFPEPVKPMENAAPLAEAVGLRRHQRIAYDNPKAEAIATGIVEEVLTAATSKDLANGCGDDKAAATLVVDGGVPLIEDELALARAAAIQCLTAVYLQVEERRAKLAKLESW